MCAVKRSALFGTEIHVAIAVEVARRQLSQWQLSVHFGSAWYSNFTDPQRQCPVIIAAPEYAPAPTRLRFSTRRAQPATRIGAARRSPGSRTARRRVPAPGAYANVRTPPRARQPAAAAP